MSTDFNALLSKPADSFERPKGLPDGEYLALIGKREFGDKNKNKTPYVRFTFQFQEALPSVDAEALALSLGDKSLNEKTMTKDFFLTAGRVLGRARRRRRGHPGGRADRAGLGHRPHRDRHDRFADQQREARRTAVRLHRLDRRRSLELNLRRRK